jgi:hypothetical protein
MRKTAVDFSRYAFAAATVGSIAVGENAKADFLPPYALNPPANGTYTGTNAAGVFGNWTSTLTFAPNFGSDALITNQPSTVEFDINNINGSGSMDIWNLTATAAASGTVSFDWNFTRTSFQGLTFGYTINGGFSSLATSTSTGSTSFSVNTGDTFGFRMFANYQGNGSVVISNFTAPVPEPSVEALVGGGAIGLLAMRAMRRRKLGRS